MAALFEITGFLDKYLDTKNIPDEWSVNGLVISGKKEVKKIALAVDPCMEALEKAKKECCDMIITHHGLFTKDEELNDVAKKRKEFLEKNSMSLYVSHYPLDVHPEIGNSKIMADLLGLKNQKPFFRIGEHYFGISGSLNKSVDDFKNDITHKIGPVLASHESGPKSTSKIAIVSGSGSDAIHQIKKEGIDTLLTGNPKHEEFYAARELKVNAVYAGHYATEVFGVKAVGEKLKNKFDKLGVLFIDAPSRL